MRTFEQTNVCFTCVSDDLNIFCECVQFSQAVYIFVKNMIEDGSAPVALIMI